MFYAHFVLSKKGPLARIWLAAHWDKKVTKAHVYETDIVSSVAAILEPKLKMALRTSGHLLLGVVRIYSRKAKYLLADCNEAYLKIKMAFRPGIVDLPEENREAALNAITLPDTLHVDFDMHLIDAEWDLTQTASGFFELDFVATSESQQARVGDITIRDSTTFSRPLRRTDEDDFGDAGYFASDFTPRHDIEMAREERRSEVRSGDALSLARNSTSIALDERSAEAAKDADPNSLLLDANDDTLGDAAAMLGLAAPSSSQPVPAPTQSRMAVDDFGDEGLGGFIADEFGTPSTAEILFRDSTIATGVSNVHDALSTLVEEPEPVTRDVLHDETASAAQNLNDIIAGAAPQRSNATVPLQSTDDTTLIAAADAFVLEPQANISALQGVAQRPGRGGPRSVTSNTTRNTAPIKRKRRLIVDEHKSIPSDAMKFQMQGTSDIVTTLELAPPTKRLMFWKEFGTADRLLAQPAAPSRTVVFSRPFERTFVRRLTVSRWSDWQEAGSRKARADLSATLQLQDNDVIELADATDLQIENVQPDATLNGPFDQHGDLFDIIDNPPDTLAERALADLSSFQKPMSPLPSANTTQFLQPPYADEHAAPDTSNCTAVPPPGLPNEALERMAMSAVAAEGLEAGEQAYLGKKVLAFYGELQQLAAATTSTPRVTRKSDAANEPSISFASTTVRATRKQAAQKFLALLFLLKQGCVSVEQRSAYANINVRLVSAASDSAQRPHRGAVRRSAPTDAGSDSDSDAEPRAKQSARSRAGHRALYASCASPTDTAGSLNNNLQRNASSLAIQ